MEKNGMEKDMEMVIYMNLKKEKGFYKIMIMVDYSLRENVIIRN